MSKLFRVGDWHAALIITWRQHRIVLRAWRAAEFDRTGRWVVIRLAPLRLITGREVSAAKLV